MAPIVFTAVLITVQEFIDWSLGIVSIMIIWYMVKFFLVAPPTEAEKAASEKEWKESGVKGRKWIKNKLNEKKIAEEKSRKKDLVSPIKDHVVKASRYISELQTNLTAMKGKKARKDLKKLQTEIKKAIRGSQELLVGVEDKDRKEVEKIINWLHALQKGFLEQVKEQIPKKIKKVKDIKTILGHFEELRGSLGNVFKHLEQFHK